MMLMVTIEGDLQVWVVFGEVSFGGARRGKRYRVAKKSRLLTAAF